MNTQFLVLSWEDLVNKIVEENNFEAVAEWY